MPSSRTLANLIEAWPSEPSNFELQAFAATLADGLPVLSAPALDRIEAQLSREMDLLTPPATVAPSRWSRVAGRIGPVGRMVMPYAAAACLLVAAGVWWNNSRLDHPATPSQPGGTFITNQPDQWQPPEPEDAAKLPKPAPTGG